MTTVYCGATPETSKKRICRFMAPCYCSIVHLSNSPDHSFVAQSNRLYTCTLGDKAWLQDFESGRDRLRVHFVTEHGRVVRIIVIQYEAYIDGEWRAMVRYDEAHGYYHKDVMTPFAGQTKVAQSAADMNSALADAIADIRKNWPEYRRTYEVAYYGKK